jgi:hypothetical protein
MVTEGNNLEFTSTVASGKSLPELHYFVHMKRRKTNWNYRILLRDRLLKHDIERKIEGRGRRERRRKQLKEERRYWNCKRKH